MSIISLETGVTSIKASRRCLSVAVIGAGNSALALSAYLLQLGHKVSLLARNREKIPGIFSHKSIVASGKIEGEFSLSDVGSDPGKIIPHVDIVFVATVAGAYGDVARTIAPFVNRTQRIILFSGKLGGVLEFSHALALCGVEGVPVLETDALFACRAQKDESIWIRGHKQWTLFSGVDRSSTIEHIPLMLEFFPGLQPALNVIERGLTDFGAVAHAPIVIANMNSIDRAEPFMFYYEGLTERTVAILHEIEFEFRELAEAYGGSLIPMKELLNRYYGCDTSSLLTAMRTVPNYRHSQAPTTLDHRFLIEDVTCTLVPAQQFAKIAGIETPMIDAVITLASVLTGINCKLSGRTMNTLGLSGLDYDALREKLNA